MCVGEMEGDAGRESERRTGRNKALRVRVLGQSRLSPRSDTQRGVLNANASGLEGRSGLP